MIVRYIFFSSSFDDLICSFHTLLSKTFPTFFHIQVFQCCTDLLLSCSFPYGCCNCSDLRLRWENIGKQFVSAKYYGPKADMAELSERVRMAIWIPLSLEAVLPRLIFEYRLLTEPKWRLQISKLAGFCPSLWWRLRRSGVRARFQDAAQEAVQEGGKEGEEGPPGRSEGMAWADDLRGALGRV